MNARTIFKSTAPFITRYSGIGKALAFRYAGRGTIFMLHSVVEDAACCPDDYLRCPVPVLQQTLSWLKNNGIEIVALDEAVRRLAEPSSRQFCVFTFDDGYADNLTLALPVMERFAAPFTVYVTTGMITGEIDAWWLGLAQLIRQTDRFAIPQLAARFECRDQAGKRRAFAAVAELIDANPDALAAVRAAIARAGIDCREIVRAEGLDSEQLRRLAASPLVTIGAHTVRHINLARASAGEAQREMTTGRRVLEDLIQREVMHFAYPFGACGPREAQIADAVGFRTAVTTQCGTLFPEHLKHLSALPREPIFGKDTPSSLRCKVDGTYRAFHSRLGDPVAHM